MSQITSEQHSKFLNLCITLHQIPQHQQSDWNEDLLMGQSFHDKIKQIGNQLNQLGGHKAMKAAIRSIQPTVEYSHEIDQLWQGIGGWGQS